MLRRELSAGNRARELTSTGNEREIQARNACVNHTVQERSERVDFFFYGPLTAFRSSPIHLLIKHLIAYQKIKFDNDTRYHNKDLLSILKHNQGYFAAVFGQNDAKASFWTSFYKLFNLGGGGGGSTLRAIDRQRNTLPVLKVCESIVT